jgi:addiction module HigA family antidote
MPGSVQNSLSKWGGLVSDSVASNRIVELRPGMGKFGKELIEVMQQAVGLGRSKKVRGRVSPRVEFPEAKAVRTGKHPKRSLPPMHPGELLREEILPALDRSKTEIAKLLGISRRTLYDVLKEKRRVTPDMALRLGKLCAGGPDLWLNLQERYDLHQAQ